MSLKVNVINKLSNQVIELADTTILVDESLSTIKEKIFVFSDQIIYYPNFIKFELKNDGQEPQFRTISDTNSLLFNFDSLPEMINIYMTNILEDIEKNYNFITIYYSDELKEKTFDKLKLDYIDLTPVDFDFILELLLFQSNSDQFSTFQTSINQFIDKIMDIKNSISKNYKIANYEISKIKMFYDYVNEVDDFDSYLESDDKKMPKIFFNTVSVIIKGNNYEPGIRGKFIKLQQIFNTIELTDELPMIVLQNPSSNEPMIKVNNHLIENISDKDFRSWVLNEKKKLNQISYKKIRGLLIKFKVQRGLYMSINLMDNGIINCKLVFPDEFEMYSLDNITTLIKDNLTIVINNINKLSGVFLKSKRIDDINNSTLMIDSITGLTQTKFLIDKQNFSKMLFDTTISENIFELKETISEDILSLYYKKYGKRESEDGDSERKGITVNIKNNPYELDSSIIQIYGAYNINQFSSIIKQIILIALLEKNLPSEDDMDISKKQKLKEKSHIKELRKQGMNILSTKCQKPRQPILDDVSKMLSNSYTIDLKGKKYVCPKKDYPYPGFTNENIICCFKKDQRRRDAYIRNVKSSDFDIIVQPSNFKITVTDPKTKLTFQTYIIKVVSDYIDGFDESNSASRYYYLSDNNQLVAITNEKLIDYIKNEEENGIWLDNVQLAKIITEPPKNKCNFPPKMTEKNSQDINAPCKHHSKNTIFGYNLNSYPCCFDKERDIYVNRKRKISDITKQHILTSDKILDYQRIGILPSSLDSLFNEIINKKSENSKFYRIGVIQNNSAFLNAILLSIDNKLIIDGEEIIINNSNEFKKYIVNYLNKNPSEFEKLNSGNISLKFGSLTNYINTILDSNKTIYWNDILDIITRITKINYMILDVPYKISESTKISDYENTRLICYPDIKVNKSHPFIFLLKRQNTYELIMLLSKEPKDFPNLGNDSDKNSSIQFEFNYSDSSNNKDIVKFFVEYYKDSCVKENVFPSNFAYDELYSLNEIINELNNTVHKIDYQIVNNFSKVDMILTKSGVLLPVRESGILNDYRVMTFSEVMIHKLSNYSDLIKTYNDINSLLKGKKINVTGISVDSENFMNAVFTNFGVFIPIKKEVFKKIEGLNVLYFRYYPEVNEYLNKYDLENDKVNEEIQYNEEIKNQKQKIYLIKTKLANLFVNNSDIKEKIENIIYSTNISRPNKIKQIVKIFNKIIKNTDIDTKNLDFYFHHIANEMLNDNKENLLLNNLVISDIFNPNEITKRESESILLNINDIKKWIKKYNRIE